MSEIVAKTDCPKKRRLGEKVAKAGSYQDAVAVIYLMLDDLRRPAYECLEARLELRVLVLDLYLAVSLCFPCPDKGEAAFLRLEGFGDTRLKDICP